MPFASCWRLWIFDTELTTVGLFRYHRAPSDRGTAGYQVGGESSTGSGVCCGGSAILRGARSAPKYCQDIGHETYIPTQSHQACPDSRFPRSHGYSRWPQGHQRPSREGSSPFDADLIGTQALVVVAN